jgi:hypothetical protein
MSEFNCYHHSDYKAIVKCVNCGKMLCLDCKQDGNLCPICRFDADSKGPKFISLIGITLFFLPFFGGAAMLIWVMSNMSGWGLVFLIFFSIAWIGGVVLGYSSVILGFIQGKKAAKQARINKQNFMVEMNLDDTGRRVNEVPYNPKKVKAKHFTTEIHLVEKSLNEID